MATASVNIDMALPLVKGPGGKTYEIFEGMKQHFTDLFEEWVKSDYNGTIMCPPFFAKEYISPIGDVSGAAPLKDSTLEIIKGDDAEEKIFDVLKEFGEKTKQPMFVLSKLKFTEFIKYCLLSKLTFPEFIKYCFQPKPDEEPKRFQVELDFVIVHLNIGVILIEVKAADKWPPDKNVYEQLQTRERVIKEGLLQGESDIPVYKVIALPNMEGTAYPKGDFVFLKKSDVDSCDEFSHWMKAHFDADKCGSQEKQELLTLLYKLVGQRTNVGLSHDTMTAKLSDEVRPDKVLTECFKNISRQSFLEQSNKMYEKQNKKAQKRRKIKKAHQKVVKTADGLDPAELAECQMLKDNGKKREAGNNSSLGPKQKVAKTADRLDPAELAQCQMPKDKGKKQEAGSNSSLGPKKTVAKTADRPDPAELAECQMPKDNGKKQEAGNNSSLGPKKTIAKTADRPDSAELAECQMPKDKEKKQEAGNNSSILGPKQTVVKTADGLKEQVLFLNLEQHRVWTGPYHQLISGAPGSGKTILLQCRALECANSGEKVIICVPVHLRNLYDDFFKRDRKNKEVISSRVKIYTFVELFEQSELLPVNEEKFHLFVDELQILTTFDRHVYLDELTRKQKGLKTFEMCYCWFAFADSQIETSRDTHDVSDTPLLDYSYRVMTDAFINSYGLSQSIAKPHLKTVMRSTKHIFEFVRDYVEKHKLYLVSETAENRSQAVADSIKHWQHQIGHRVVGDRVDERTGTLSDVVEIIKTEIKTWKKLRNVAVLVTDVNDLEYLSHRCNAVNIPVCGVGENKDAVVVACEHWAFSYEWPVVIAVDLTSKSDYHASMGNYIIYSRAVMRLIVVKPFSYLQPLQEQLDRMLDEQSGKRQELLDLEKMDSICNKNG